MGRFFLVFWRVSVGGGMEMVRLGSVVCGFTSTENRTFGWFCVI